MHILLNMARRNFGDFLILESFKKLLNKFRPDIKTEILDGFEDLEKQRNLDFINSAKAIILYGGPGYSSNMYPEVYPLSKNIDRIKTRIFMGGMGTFIYPVSEKVLENYKFNPPTQKLLHRVSGETDIIGSRDFITQRVLKSNGIKNVVMTGCPAWYDPDSFGKDFETPSEIQTLIFTPPQYLPYFPQAKKILKHLKSNFPKTRIIISFHRGLNLDHLSRKNESPANRNFAEFAKKLGCETADISYGGTQKNEFYKGSDIHIGYRVHGHIWFLSRRKPSILIAEDSRGLGVINALHTPGISGFYEGKPFSEMIPLTGLANKIAKRATAGYFIKKDGVAEETIRILKQEIESGFARFAGKGFAIDRCFEKGMKRFIESLPE